MVFSLITYVYVEVLLYLHLSPVTEGNEYPMAQCYIEWGDTTERKLSSFVL